MIDPDHPRLSIVRQCELASVSRASFYREPAGEREENLVLMRLIDEAFLDCPFYGARQMIRHLRRLGWKAGRKRVRRLMRKIGLAPIYQAPKTSAPHPRHKVYPYLLRQLDHRAAQPGLVRRCHLHPDAAGLPLPCRHHGLGDAKGSGVASVEHDGSRLLRRGA